MKTNPWMISTLLLAGLLVGFGVAQVPAVKNIVARTAVTSATEPTGIEDTNVTPENNTQPATRELSAEQIKKLPDDDPVKGEVNAPITVVEFSDFQCPYCQRFWKQTLPSIMENYVNTGKVRLVHRDFPLDFHPQAPTAALASECADDQKKFWEMHDLLFTKQSEWVENPKVEEVMNGFAKELGINTTEFSSCMKTKKHAEEINKDTLDGAILGVNGTPAFFINGKELSGAMPYEEVFKPIFEAELAGKKWEVKYDAAQRPFVKIFE